MLLTNYTDKFYQIYCRYANNKYLKKDSFELFLILTDVLNASPRDAQAARGFDELNLKDILIDSRFSPLLAPDSVTVDVGSHLATDLLLRENVSKLLDTKRYNIITNYSAPKTQEEIDSEKKAILEDDSLNEQQKNDKIAAIVTTKIDTDHQEERKISWNEYYALQRDFIHSFKDKKVNFDSDAQTLRRKVLLSDVLKRAEDLGGRTNYTVAAGQEPISIPIKLLFLPYQFTYNGAPTGYAQEEQMAEIWWESFVSTFK